MASRGALLLTIGAAAIVGVLAMASTNVGGYEAGLDTHYQRTDDLRKIIVTATVGRDDDILGYSAREDAMGVRLTVHARNPNPSGWHDLAGYSRTVVITLRDPLGDRKVVDARTGHRLEDLAVSLERREVGLIEKDSYRASDGVVDLRWSDSKGVHALSDLRGTTVVLLTRGNSYDQQSDSKRNMLGLAGYLYNAPDDERAKTAVFVISFDRANAVAPDDVPFRPLFSDPNAVSGNAPEILQPSAPAMVWFLGPDGRLRERLIGAATPEQVAQALAAAR